MGSPGASHLKVGELGPLYSNFRQSSAEDSPPPPPGSGLCFPGICWVLWLLWRPKAIQRGNHKQLTLTVAGVGGGRKQQPGEENLGRALRVPSPSSATRVHEFSPSHSSVQFSCLVMSDSLQPHEPQHARPPCPSPTPRVYPNSCPLSRWCHPTISSSVIPFSSRLQSFPASGSFPMSQLFASGDQSTGASS